MKPNSSLTVGLLAMSMMANASSAMAYSQSSVIQAPVVDVQPVVEVVSERIPYESCRPERVRVQDRNRFAGAVPTVVGALIGGSVANVLGRNSSKEDVITGAGALIGGTVGYSRSQRQRVDDGYYVTENICTTEYELRERERVNGYRVSYRYDGAVYETRADRDPGATIPVRVRLEPLP